MVARETTGDDDEPTLQRTTDGGRTFTSVGRYTPVGSGSARTLPKWFDGKLYWLTKEGLIVTDDAAATWTKLADVADALYGPIFGKDAEHQFVLTRKGIVESTDAGRTWSAPLPLPTGLEGTNGLCWLEFDPRHDTLYVMKMTSDLYRWKRGG